MTEIVKDLEDKVLLALDPFYPVITDPGFFLLPLPAAYEFVNVARQGHSDGQQLRRLAIVGSNAAVGTLMYKYGLGIGSTLMNYYLLGGTAYYAFFKLIIGAGPIARPTPDLDPCGNPIERGGEGGRTGGGGAC
jgi:hypothetical protein